MLAVCLLVSPSTSAYDFMVGGLCYNKNSDGNTVTVTYERTIQPYYTALSGALTIPASVTNGGKTYSVTAIDANAFRGCTGLTAVTVPNTVASVGNYAFQGCTAIAKLTWNAANCAGFSFGSTHPFYGVTSSDIACIVNVLAGLDDTKQIKARADVNGEGEVTAADVADVVNILAGID